ncbi:MAG: PSD1 and planctomycete cytochrome C domain-containing protein [Planctomycetaceae bacterium]
MALPSLADDDRERFFESEIRPILAENCIKCHGAEEQSGKLRLDSAAALRAGGERGAVLNADQPGTSLILQAVRHEGELEMPPDGKLSEQQIAALTKWVESGAFWPESRSILAAKSRINAADHWAFQPVTDPAVPTPQRADWVRTPVDAFVLAKLEASGLAPSPEADRRTLIRRVKYALTGLPPSADEVSKFAADSNPQAYTQLVERLLNSPQYGEQWARHWLDVARYADTKGYVYAREERFWVHAWAYRDWVVRAFNEDLPFDRFLLLQIAADQVSDRRPNDLAAMGYLTIGRRFLGVERDIFDDRIDVVARGTMGLTAACARCHDHKYDPIPQADYYSLYGVFDSSREEYVRLDSTKKDDTWETELANRQEKLRTTLAAARTEWAGRVRGRSGDYLRAQTELSKYPEQGFDQILEKDDILPEFVRRWRNYLEQAAQMSDPVFVPWHAYIALPADEFSAQTDAVTRTLHQQADKINPLVLAAFATPPATFSEVIDRYAALLKEIDAKWQAQVATATATQSPAPTELNEPAAEQLRHVLYGADSPCEVPDEPVVHSEGYFDTKTCEELWKLQGEVDRWLIKADQPPTYALALADRTQPHEPHIFLRGNPATRGPLVTRQFFGFLAGKHRQPFSSGSGRLELARAIIDPANPLTARVIVNRIWAQHFGTGLVRTPSDFGTRAEQPSHPELLDWLASRMIQGGWKLKDVQRMIVLSSAFRQSSTGPENAELLAAAQRLDPDNRLLWRMNEHRLTFEEFRDSMLAASGDLDFTPGGKPAELFTQPYPTRRTLYGLVDRQFLPGTLRMFDFANPDLHIPQRSETTVPQQALFVMNHPLVLDRARALAKSVPEGLEGTKRIAAMYERAYQREPTAQQLAAALEFIAAAETAEPAPVAATVADWQYGYGAVDEATQRVTAFTSLPHFTGSGWQGSAAYPDTAGLGWVQLSPKGGHPGNDRQHAAIRRWTAPRSMTIAIQSELTNEPEAGDGIRGFIVSSGAGVAVTATVHHGTNPLNVESLAVTAGQTIDFLVDIKDVLNNDQFVWKATIKEVVAAGAPTAAPVVWNSEQDFTHEIIEQLGPWEQLAQLLLCANEFVFVD